MDPSTTSLSPLIPSETPSPPLSSRRFQPDLKAKELIAFLDAHRATSSTGRFLIKDSSSPHTEFRLVVTDGGCRPSNTKRKTRSVAGIGVVWGTEVDMQISHRVKEDRWEITSGCAELLAMYEGIKAVAADEDSINPRAPWSLVVATDYLSLVDLSELQVSVQSLVLKRTLLTIYLSSSAGSLSQECKLAVLGSCASS